MARYTFDAGKDFDALLEKLSADKSTTKAEVIRRAVASYAYLNKETMKDERKVSITNDKDEVVKDVVLP